MGKRLIIGKITGFTLAEVLITLTIIGVVAALTIPALMQNIQDAQLKTAWKKVYSDINQATLRIKSDNGGTMIGLFNGFNSTLNDAYLKYLNPVRNCYSSFQADGNCWHSDNTWKTLNGSSMYSYYASKTGAILNNGVLLGFWTENTAANCDVGTIQSCGKIFVDVNGFKGPNTLGKDIYMIHVVKDGIEPYGIPGDGSGGDCVSTGSGYSCSTRYLYQ